MTYCLGIAVEGGLTLVSDSRTNAGIDNISTYGKMRTYGIEGERQFILCVAGNLATTQAVVAQIERDIRQHAETSLLTVPNVSDAATYIGALSRQFQQRNTGGGPVFEASFLIGGEVKGSPCRLHLVYPEGNYIETSRQTPFLQIGESKYGKPILDRLISMDTALPDTALCALVSMDATMRSNLTVGPPIELNCYEAGSLKPGRYIKYQEDSPYLRRLRRGWDAELLDAFRRMPGVEWAGEEAE